MSRITATLWAEDRKQMQFASQIWLVGQIAAIRGCAYSGLLICSVGYTWQHLTAWQHRDLFCRRFCRGRKAHGKLSPGAAVQSCAGKRNRYHGRGEEQHWNTPAPPHAALELQQQNPPLAMALRQAGELSLLSVLHLKCLPADPGSALSSHSSSALSLSLLLSPTVTWSTTQPRSCHTVWCHSPYCVSAPSLHILTGFFTEVQPSFQQSLLLQESPIMHLLLQAVQRYSSERSRNIPLKLLLSSVQAGFSALLQKTSSEKPTTTQKKARSQSQQTFFNILA